MGDYYEDKYYHNYFDEIIEDNNEQDFYKNYDNFPGLIEIPTIFDFQNNMEIWQKENISFSISNKLVQASEKEHKEITIPLQSKISNEKDNDSNINLKKPNESTFLEKENLNEKIKQKQNVKTFLSNKTKSLSENNNTNIYTNKNDNTFKDAFIRMACNNKVLKNTLELINNKIKELYNNIIGKGILLKQLKPLQKLESNIKYNKELLNKTLKDIFSDNIYGKITSFPKDYNKKLIKNLLNEKDIAKKEYFNKLFDMKFIQCLEHYRGTHFYNELNGMRLFKDESNQIDEDFYEHLNYYFNNYEEIINNKKSRKSRNKEKTTTSSDN